MGWIPSPPPPFYLSVEVPQCYRLVLFTVSSCPLSFIPPGFTSPTFLPELPFYAPVFFSGCPAVRFSRNLFVLDSAPPLLSFLIISAPRPPLSHRLFQTPFCNSLEAPPTFPTTLTSRAILFFRFFSFPVPCETRTQPIPAPLTCASHGLHPFYFFDLYFFLVSRNILGFPPGLALFFFSEGFFPAATPFSLPESMHRLFSPLAPQKLPPQIFLFLFFIFLVRLLPTSPFLDSLLSPCRVAFAPP